MNRFHRKFCRSKLWKRVMELHLFSWAVEGVERSGRVLELGPGYGVASDLLLPRCEQLTCLEIDRKLATNLKNRLQPNAKATVLQGDARSMPFSESTFDAVFCFMMLHHVTPLPAQDVVFSEAMRVLKPGGTFAGADSPQSLALRILHLFDRVNMVDRRTLAGRLESAGFEDVHVSAARYAFRFRARKPETIASQASIL